MAIQLVGLTLSGKECAEKSKITFFLLSSGNAANSVLMRSANVLTNNGWVAQRSMTLHSMSFGSSLYLKKITFICSLHIYFANLISLSLVVRVNRIETRSGRRTAVLRILRKYHNLLGFISLDLLQSVLRQRIHIAKANVMLVRSRFGGFFVELFDQEFALQIGPLQDWRSAADFGVLLLDFGGSALGDPWTEFAV